MQLPIHHFYRSALGNYRHFDHHLQNNDHSKPRVAINDSVPEIKIAIMYHVGDPDHAFDADSQFTIKSAAASDLQRDIHKNTNTLHTKIRQSSVIATFTRLFASHKRINEKVGATRSR